MKTLAFAPMLLETLKREAAAFYPHEMCGLLIGRDGFGPGGEWRLVERIEPVKNVATNKSRRFAIDPGEMLRWERAAADEGKLILGFYHSHPDHPARPSEHDRQEAWPVYSYVIASTEEGACGDVTSWVYREETEKFEPQAIADMTQVDQAAD
jgi:proteasome lid subunit RPN8/RPN11